MKLRCRRRHSATVLHLSVLMPVGSALPFAIRASRPALSIGARQPVSAVFAAAWDICFSPDGGGRIDVETERSVSCIGHANSFAVQKLRGYKGGRCSLSD